MDDSEYVTRLVKSCSCLYCYCLILILGDGVGASTEVSVDLHQDDANDGNKSTEEGNAASYDTHLTPAERRYMEQKEKIDVHFLAKTANKSHRDRIEDFNQYLANMSEHYDIPKVGPG